MLKPLHLLVSLLVKVGFSVLLLISLLGCRVGEDDPLLSFRSRDERLKGSWRLRQLTSETQVNRLVPGGIPTETVVTSTYDGRDLKVLGSINDNVAIDTTLGFAYLLEIQNRGRLVYTSTVIQQGLGVKSGGEDSWFWLSDDKPKSRVYLGNALEFTQTLNSLLQISAAFPEFEVLELRKDLLRLSLRRRVEQTGLDGSFQETQVNSTFEFRPN